MKRFLLLFFLINILLVDFAFVQESSSEWIPFSNPEQKENARIESEVFSEREISLTVPLFGMYLKDEIMEDGIDYKKVSVPGSGVGEVGKPDLPVFGTWILIPNGTELEISVNPGTEMVYENLNISPVQPPKIDSEDAPDPPFTKDEITYTTDADYPGEFYYVESTKIIRGQECTIVRLCPFQCNPVSELLKVYKDLQITIRFNGEIQPIPERLRNRNFDTLFRRLAPNAEEVLAVE